MAQNDFTLKVTADFSEVLAGFSKLKQPAEQAGAAVGKGLGDGITAAGKTVDALIVQLLKLQQQKATLKVDTNEYKQAEQQIEAIKAEMAALRNQKVQLQADASQLNKATESLDKIQAEINTLGNQKVQLQADASQIDKAADALGDLGDEADNGANRFGLLEGAVAGVAATLSSAVVDGAQRAVAAVGALINSYAALDTEIRKAAAAAGEAGGYEKIARTVDQVGIEAAGTTLEVAQLATELIRGGMTIDQANQSLGAIVRGAEATGTGFAQMGEVVSASLKGFGMEAGEAQRVVDALSQGANASAASVSGLGMSFKYAAPVAKILGLSVEDVAVATGLLTNAGIDASEAGVTLRNGLSKLASAAPATGGQMQKLTGQAAQAATAMKSLGVDIYNADGTLKPMETTLITLKRAFENLDPATKIRLAANLFGGEDDGTKWLALLNQSESEIKKMADAMANTKGSTDKARDAMQGFELKMKQLQGTLDSIGNTIGGVAAAALLPLVDAANAAIGAFSALPTPIKQTISAVALLAGGITTATAAFVVFKTALALPMVQAAITGIGTLTAGIGTTLVGGIKAAVAAMPALIAQMAALSSITVGQAIAALGTLLRTTFLSAIGAASQGLLKFLLFAQSANFSAFISSVGGVVGALAPLAVLIGAVVAAVKSWQYVLGGAKQVQDDFTQAQKRTQDAIDKLNVSLKQTPKATEDTRNAFQKLFDQARESMAMRELALQFEKLQGNFTTALMGALAFYNQLKSSKGITEEQISQSKQQIETLSVLAKVAEDTAKSFRLKAQEAEREKQLDLASQYLRDAQSAELDAQSKRNLIAAFKALLPEKERDVALTEEQKRAVEARIKAEQELNRIIAEAPVRALEQQITLGNQLVQLTQSLAGLEQSRYSITRSQLEYELGKAQEREASEATINAIKRQIETQDRQALSARYQALQLEQQLQEGLLRLSQQKARQEADLSILQQRVEILNAERAVSKAKTAEDKAAAEAQLSVQQAILGIQFEKRNALTQTQPIEAAIAGIQRETADNALRAEAAAKGFKLEADGSLTPMRGLAGTVGRVAELTVGAKDSVADYSQLAAQAGLQIGRAKDGTIVLGQSWEDVKRQVTDINAGLGGIVFNTSNAQGAADQYNQKASASQRITGEIVDGVIQIQQEFDIATGKAGTFDAEVSGASGTTDNIATGVGGIKTALEKVLGPAAAMVGAFTSAGDEAPKAVTAAQGFAGALSTANSAGAAIKGINLDDYMGAVSTNTSNAARAAQSFYDWLQKAARLPASRWTGGPVEGGESYRVNELGQEALLSGGRLSLINAPSGGTWRAPSSGVVVPAGITAELQARGALPGRAARLTGGGSAIAEQAAVGAQQAVVLGKLEQAVDRLAAREWNVNVTMRQGPTGSQVIRHLNRLL